MRPLDDLARGLANTRKSMGDGTLSGRSRIATPYDPRRLRRATSAVTGGDSDLPVGEAIVLSGTVTVPAGGGGIASQLDTIVARNGFETVINAGDAISLPLTASWRVDAYVRWTDGDRQGGTVEVLRDGTVVAETFPREGRWWNAWEGHVAFLANRRDVFDLKITSGDGAERDAEVWVAVTMLEELRYVENIVVAPTYFVENEAIDSSTAGNPDAELYDVWTYVTINGSNIEEGDLLILTAGVDQYSAFTRTGTIEVPAGWTGVYAESYNGGTTVSLCAYKIASAADAAGTASYPVRIKHGSTSTQYTSWGGAWIVSALRGVSVIGTPTWVAGPFDTTPPYDDLPATAPNEGTAVLAVYNGTDRFIGSSAASAIVFDSAVTAVGSSRYVDGIRQRIGQMDPGASTLFTFTGGADFGRPFVAFLPVLGVL